MTRAAFGWITVLAASLALIPLPVSAAPPGGLGGLDRPMDFRSMRSSSADPNWENGNWDARPIEPGETLTFAELEGPGRITHIWFTVSAKDRAYPRSMTLRMYWDGSEEPAVESPLGDFFAVGHGIKRQVDSQPVAVSSNGRAYNCYWPMPFRTSAKLTMSNDSDQRVNALFWYVDWQKHDAMAADTPYFHAQYRQEFPCEAGKDYLLLDTEGKGHYVGTVLSVRVNEHSWFGEGDDRFYIDGEEEPSLRGTGSEDYFCDAWGFREFMRPYYGVTIWEGWSVGHLCTAYRWHIQDPVAFEKSLKVTIEHKGARVDPKTFEMENGYTERADDFSSVAFWYQTGKATRFASMPPAADRLAKRVVIEAEASLEACAGTPEVQTSQAGRMWSGGSQVFFPSADPASELTVPFAVEEAGTYLAFLHMTWSQDYGTYDVYLDDEKILGPIDFYNETVKSDQLRLGHREFDAGEHRLTFKCVGANEKSKLLNADAPGYSLGVDALVLERVNPPPRP